jgi:16S rRNA (cytidine1402-2'-O)-methyltransferase
VVSTPIGNLGDITLRALDVLRGVDTIAAEKVRHTKGLCEHYGVKTRLSSYHQHNQKKKAPELIRALKRGRDVAVVTDAGTPGISDPGVFLIDRAMKEGIKVSPVPGPSAVVAALSVSGLPTGEFVFLGFLPNKSGRRRRVLEALIQESRTVVLFEAPHRLKEMLSDVREILGDRHMVMLREMTKVFEEVERGPVSAILEHLTPDRLRGEFTFVLAGCKKQEKTPRLKEAVLKKMDALLAEDRMSIRDTAHRISEEEGLPFRQVYKACLSRKKGS